MSEMEKKPTLPALALPWPGASFGGKVVRIVFGAGVSGERLKKVGERRWEVVKRVTWRVT